MIFYFFCSVALAAILPSFLKKYKTMNSLTNHTDDIKYKKNNTPILGGLIFIIPVILYLIETGDYKLLIFILFSTSVGFIDDLNKIRNKNRHMGINRKIKTLYLTLIFVLFTFLFPMKVDFNVKTFLYFVMVYTGVLVTDGIDGLLAILAFLTYTIYSINNGLTPLIQILMVTIIPYIYVNKNPAQIFMGDTGAFFIASILYYLIGNESVQLYSVYILGSTTSLLQMCTLFFNKKILLKAPFHHNLEMLNWTENQIVLLYASMYLITWCMTTTFP